MTILMVIVPAQIIPRTWGALTGIVCIAQTTDVKCPTSPPVFNGPVTSPSTLLRAPVFINQTDTINGYDITLKVGDASKLKPFDVDFTGTVVPPTVVLVECIG